MTTLKDAIKNNKLNDFIKARSKEEKKGGKDIWHDTCNQKPPEVEND